MAGRVRRLFLAAVIALLVVTAAPARAQQPDDDGVGPGTTGPGYVPGPPAAWILVDADTGAVLDGEQPRTPQLPASTIKLFTALVAHQRLPAGDNVPISAHAESMPARKINVKAGQEWRLEDLLYSMLLVSANDAAVAVAERVGGGSLEGWERIAAQAADALGLEDAPDLSDPAGLDDAQFSHGGGSRISPRDMAIVARAVLAEPALLAMIQTEEHLFDGGDGIGHSVDRRIRLFDLYPGTIGLKTGLTDAAGRCFVAAATRDGRTMLAVLFDAPDIYASAAILLDQGFATPVAAEEGLDHLPAVVPDAAADPPERIPGALDPTMSMPAANGGLDWNSAPVAIAILVAGTAPLLSRRRRQRRSRRGPGGEAPRDAPQEVEPPRTPTSRPKVDA
jgi:D-alanyl-D-alanine carboxypeptidase (penicillin-binding protein 5/6)